MNTQKSIRSWFSLGARLDAAGRYREALDAWNIGNAMQDRLVEWNEPQENADIERILQAFPLEVKTKSLPSHIPKGIVPIFILGMPRSGSTLLEQILTSHPDVAAGGELTFMGECIGDLEDDALNPAYAAQLGKMYIDRIEPLAKGKRFITDKLPANFIYLGLIARALPHAVIFHTSRSGADTCLSCWSKLFNEANLGWTYDIGTMERYYTRYVRVMKHWRQVMPEAFIDVNYEYVVHSPEDAIRRVVDYAGLTWNDACMHPEKNNRVVKTASRLQVKKPMYKTSIGRWKNYPDPFERFWALDTSGLNRRPPAIVASNGRARLA